MESLHSQHSAKSNKVTPITTERIPKSALKKAASARKVGQQDSFLGDDIGIGFADDSVVESRLMANYSLEFKGDVPTKSKNH